MKKLDTVIVQLDSVPERDANLSRIRELSETMGNPDLVVLPEVFSCRGGDEDYRATAEDPYTGPAANALASLAKQKKAWIAGGSIMEMDRGNIYKTMLVYNRRGKLAAKYRKTHLFSLYEDGVETVSESRVCSAGTEPVVINLEGWKIGLSICYDLRFPELYRDYAAAGCDAILAPSDFTRQTGRDHWHVLTRARSIENQCFVIAPNQCGANRKTGIESYGHSLAADPWGRIIAEAEAGEEALQVTLDPILLTTARSRLPALEAIVGK
jgi:nitrilase